MTIDRFRFLRPEVGDEVIRRSTRLKIDLWHSPGESGEPPHVECGYELHGGFTVAAADAPADDTAQLLRDLLQVFRTAERRDVQ